jgi:quercetin dioxygenase-like cupin family protein
MALPVIKQAETQVIDESWGSITWLASGAIGNSRKLTVGRVVIKPGCANPRHCHEGSEEVLHLLSGTLEHSYGDKAYPMSPGDTIAVPAGVFHNARSTGAADAVMVVAFATPTRTIRLEEVVKPQV